MIEIWWPGKTQFKYAQTGIVEYLDRAKKYRNISVKEFSTPKQISDPQSYIAFEELQYVKQLTNKEFVVLLDADGKSMDSIQFAQWFGKIIDSHPSNIVFIIGGSYGFSDAFKSRAHALISLSQFTMPHDLARLVFMEQLYRACTILKGIKYHH